MVRAKRKERREAHVGNTECFDLAPTLDVREVAGLSIHLKPRTEAIEVGDNDGTGVPSHLDGALEVVDQRGDVRREVVQSGHGGRKRRADADKSIRSYGNQFSMVLYDSLQNERSTPLPPTSSTFYPLDHGADRGGI